MARRLRLAVHLATLGLLSGLTASAEPPTESPSRVCTDGSVSVRTSPDWKAARRGVLLDCAVVELVREQDGPGCKEPWAEMRGGGWICLDYVAPSAAPLPQAHPMVAFDHPTPEDLATYRASGTYERSVGPAAEALLPYVYGRRSGRFEGRCHADVQAKQRGDAPVKRLDPSRRQAFVEVIETDEGGFLRRPDGTVVPVDDVYLYAPSRFEGVDLVQSPGPEGSVPAWVRSGGGRWREEATVQAPILRELPARAQVFVGPAVEGTDGRTWCPLRQVDGEPATGFIASSRLRRLRALPAPSGVAPDTVWIDVDLSEQVLTLLRGETPEYVTLVSTGVRAHATPPGIYRLGDKMLHWDMASLDGASDPYHIEEVPWVMHFWPRYALHAAFWHDGFGEQRSHGCINLAPRDAQQVFDRTAPRVPPGWHTVWETSEDPGSILRVRSDRAEVPDRRRAL